MSISTKIVEYAIKFNSSDIHLEEGSKIALRVNSDIKLIDKVLQKEDMDQLLNELLGEVKLKEYYKSGDLDTSIGLNGLSRIRINAYMAREKRCLTLRILPDNLPDWKDLGLPSEFIKLTKKDRGLVLCTGPTGSGKSTTLAAFINCILETQNKHILTIEDPIEFEFNSTKNSIIHQREVKRDTHSFSSALKGALREDPDIIYIGEMRDLETIQLAITAAETGHLVLGTLHTSSASKTVERIVDVFPADQQEQARLQVSTSLVGIMSQTLCKNIKGTRSLAYELLINTSAISNLIRERKVSQIYSQLQTGSNDGMNTLEQCLQELINNQEITFEEGLSKSSNPKALSENN
ncbi:type IV pilus twitching motility protein PilT [Prochlorococcus marinus]|uniref:Type IV pili twitching motility protein PilT n=1 Tax=Prochlorococcus marinus XMU1408 TaxID=2213228 RepID=A0A318RCB4_PROMR|nr:PilT/PilU family type 4a pilus ATPase [Prochlorococcus marinus]PYE01072.1 type IV pili twitching motility protein PilT [Prochlorococcus marinus XMU1408]